MQCTHCTLTLLLLSLGSLTVLCCYQSLDDDQESLSGMRMDDGVMSPEDSDLAQLRSLNDGECSADWYNFQVGILVLNFSMLVLFENFLSIVFSRCFSNFPQFPGECRPPPTFGGGGC